MIVIKLILLIAMFKNSLANSLIQNTVQPNIFPIAKDTVEVLLMLIFCTIEYILILFYLDLWCWKSVCSFPSMPRTDEKGLFFNLYT